MAKNALKTPRHPRMKNLSLSLYISLSASPDPFGPGLFAALKRVGALVIAILLPVLMALAPWQLALAQQKSPPLPDFSKGRLTVEMVQSYLKDFEGRADLEDVIKAKAVEIYQDTMEYLRFTAEWEAKVAEFEKASREAPATLKAIQKELAKPREESMARISPNLSLQQMEQSLAQAEAYFKAERDKASILDEERKHRAERRNQLPNSIAEARQKLEKLAKQMAAAPAKEDPPELKSAKQAQLHARKSALEGELQSYEKEMASYDARGTLLIARRDLAAREVAQAEVLAHAWQEVVNERRRVEAEAAARAAEQAKLEAARSHPLMRKLTEENATLAERRARDHLADRIERAVLQYDATTKTLAKLNGDFQSVTSKVQAAGLTHAIGLLLRRQWSDLSSIHHHRRSVAARQSEISAIQVQIIELEDERSRLSDIERLLREMMEEVRPSLSEPDRKGMEPAIRELLHTRRGYIDSLINDFNTLFVKLVDIDAEERRLIAETEKFAEYIGRRVLWIHSAMMPQFSDLPKMWEALRWIASAENWGTVWDSLRKGTQSRPFFMLFGLLAFVSLLRGQRRIRSAISEMGETASGGFSTSFWPTAYSLVLTALAAIIWPCFFLFFGWLLASSLYSSDFSRAVAAGLEAVAVAFLTAEMFRQICRKSGLAKAHFQWLLQSMKLIRGQLAWLMALGLPALFVLTLMEGTDQEAWKNSLGRAAFMVGQILLSIFSQRVFRPKGGAFQEVMVTEKTGWRRHLYRLLYPLLVGIPLALAALSFVGYHYTALQLTKRLLHTLWILLILLLGTALSLRWLLVSRRRLAIQNARERQAAQEAMVEEGGDTSAGRAPETEIDLITISGQTQNLLRSAVGLSLVVGLWFVWDDMLPALRILNGIELWSSTTVTVETLTDGEGKLTSRSVEHMTPISLADLLLALLVLTLTIVGSRNIPGLLEFTILRRLSVQAGERYAISAISRYVIIIVGFVATFGVIGIGWSKVQWLAAAITVGLGFGLQEIFANFVSGLILFFERPIRVDDVVTVGEVEGRVSQINIRATTILDWNRRELVVPNKEFVTGKFINWTLSDPITRILIPIGVAYGSDTELARELLLKIAHECPHVVEKPRPKTLFRSFGDNALQLELHVYIPNLDAWTDAMNYLHTAIDKEFRKAGIEIAFPQRDIHIRSIKDSLTLAKKRKDLQEKDAGGEEH